MDSRDVNREIRRVIRPMLKEQGFNVYTERNYWRHLEDRVEVINFQSWNWYGANPSRVRSLKTGYVALELGLRPLALEMLGQALASGCYDYLRERIETEMERAKALVG